MPSPHEAVRAARPGRSVIGWKLDRTQRADLLERLAPRYPNVVADHVTLAAKVASGTAKPDPVTAQAVGRIDDLNGVEAVVVAVEGTTERPGGGTYHTTWSLGPGRQARESNDALAAREWEPLPEPIPLSLAPASWP